MHISYIDTLHSQPSILSRNLELCTLNHKPETLTLCKEPYTLNASLVILNPLYHLIINLEDYTQYPRLRTLRPESLLRKLATV